MRETTTGPEQLSDQQMNLARAMATRDVQEELQTRAILDQFMPQAPVPPIEVLEGIELGKTMFMLTGLQNPDASMSAADTFPLIMTDDVLANLWRIDKGSEPSEEDISDMRTLLQSSVSLTWEALDRNVVEQGQFRTIVDVAYRIAETHGVPPEDVFLDEELYAEHMRSIRTPQEHIDTARQDAEKFTPDLLLTVIRNWVRIGAQQAAESDDLSAEEVEQEIEEMIAEMIADPEITQELQAIVEQYQIANKRYLRQQLERFWGQQGFESLMPEAKQWLLEGNREVKVMAHMAVSQRQRNDFIQNYAEQRGWDPNHLTVAQMQEMGQSDEFKSLGNTDS